MNIIKIGIFLFYYLVYIHIYVRTKGSKKVLGTSLKQLEETKAGQKIENSSLQRVFRETQNKT